MDRVHRAFRRWNIASSWLDGTNTITRLNMGTYVIVKPGTLNDPDLILNFIPAGE